jgi:PncC family amidohydrolase
MNDPHAEALSRALHETGATLAVAESCTGGGLAHRITEIPGISSVFLGGIIAYDNEVKISLLGVPRETIVEHGAVSAATAEQMAVGCRTRFGATLTVSITGIAGPSGGTPEKPVGTVFVAVADAAGVACQRLSLSGDRSEIRHQAETQAIAMLIERLSTRRDRG